MKNSDSTVTIREAGHGMDELTTGKILASSIDYIDPQGLIGQTVNVHMHDENGNPEECEGILIEVLD